MYRIFIVEDDAAIAQAVCEQAESWALEARCVSDFRRVAEETAEFREFFPENAVEYFISYYDYYQPEAYIAQTDTYIEKEPGLISNEEPETPCHRRGGRALLTTKGKATVAFAREARTEVRKVIWPTRQETLHTTLIVAADR